MVNLPKMESPSSEPESQMWSRRTSAQDRPGAAQPASGLWRMQVTPYNFILPSVGSLGEPLFSYFVCLLCVKNVFILVLFYSCPVL